MIAVSRFEANLLRILHGILQHAPIERVRPLVVNGFPPPACLSRDAVTVIKSTLARGMVSLLARRGWQRERFLRQGQVRDGRLWQRIPLEERRLEFSAFSMRFLIWLTATSPDQADTPGDASQRTIADRLLVLLAYHVLRSTNMEPRLTKCDFIANDALCRLLYPYSITGNEDSPDWKPWTSAGGMHVLEALQPMFSERFIEVERSQAGFKDANVLLARCKERERTLTSFLDAIDKVKRRDLARFLLPTLRTLLRENQNAGDWTKGVDLKLIRLADLLEVRRAKLLLLRVLLRLRDWEREARSVGYFDDDYAASQLWKSDWERYDGEELCHQAETILRDIEPLKSG